MIHLVKGDCTLRFTEHEFVEFFGIISPLDEDACSYTYILGRDGLRLKFTLFPIDGGAYISVYWNVIAEPTVTSSLQGCTHSRFALYGSQLCLDIGISELPTSETSVALNWGLRLFIEPHFRLEFIHEVG